MPIRDNPILGYTLCSECEELASVHQQSRGAGRYLYTRGCDCKYRNSTGAKFQTRLWLETDWLDNIEPIKPPNALESYPATVESHDCYEKASNSKKEQSTNNWLAVGFTFFAGLALIVITGGRSQR